MSIKVSVAISPRLFLKAPALPHAAGVTFAATLSCGPSAGAVAGACVAPDPAANCGMPG